jgi:hypothetical protein
MKQISYQKVASFAVIGILMANGTGRDLQLVVQFCFLKAWFVPKFIKDFSLLSNV